MIVSKTSAPFSNTFLSLRSAQKVVPKIWPDQVLHLCSAYDISKNQLSGSFSFWEIALHWNTLPVTEACTSYSNKPVNSSFRRGFFVARFPILFMLWNNLYMEEKAACFSLLIGSCSSSIFLPLFCFIYMQLLRNFFLQDLPVPCW